MADLDPRTGKVLKRSTSFMGFNTIHRNGGDRYMTRYWLGRLRLHIFHRGDDDQDPHDHPWGFATFPLQSYVEEVTEKLDYKLIDAAGNEYDGYEKRLQVVPAFRWNKRKCEHLHRVLGVFTGYITDPFGGFEPISARAAAKLDSRTFIPQWEPLNGRKLITIVIRTGFNRRNGWGFLKNRDGKWCWIHFKEYIASGGSPGPCE